MADTFEENPLFQQLGLLSKAAKQSPLLQAFGPYPTLQDYMGYLPTIELKKYRQYFLNQQINLDGYFFEECRFDNCVLITESANVNLKNCVIGPGTSLKLSPHLIQVAKLLSIFNKFPNDWLPSVSKVGDIFTISIP
jgi:hypothetical protein